MSFVTKVNVQGVEVGRMQTPGFLIIDGPETWRLILSCFNGEQVSFPFKFSTDGYQLPEPLSTLMESKELETFHVGVRNKSCLKMTTTPAAWWLLNMTVPFVDSASVAHYPQVEAQYNTKIRYGKAHFTVFDFGRFNCLGSVWEQIVWSNRLLTTLRNRFRDFKIGFHSTDRNFHAWDFAHSRKVNRAQNSSIEYYDAEFARHPENDSVIVVLKGTTVGWNFRDAISTPDEIIF